MKQLPKRSRVAVTLAFSLLALVGCAKDKGQSAQSAVSTSAPTARWMKFPVPLQADISVTQNPEREEDLRVAMKFWENHAGKKLFDYQGTRNVWRRGRPYEGLGWERHPLAGNVVYFEPDWPFSSRADEHAAGRTLVQSQNGWIQNAVVLIHQIDDPAPACARCSIPLVAMPGARRALMAHELGHFLGLSHSTDPQNIMYPTVDSMRALHDYTVDQSALNQVTQ